MIVLTMHDFVFILLGVPMTLTGLKGVLMTYTNISGCNPTSLNRRTLNFLLSLTHITVFTQTSSKSVFC
jgi:hypothetical protein